METSEKTKLNDETKMAELTVRDLKAIVREIVENAVERAILELQQQLPDPDGGLEFKPDVTEQLREYLRERPKGRPAGRGV